MQERMKPHSTSIPPPPQFTVPSPRYAVPAARVAWAAPELVVPRVLWALAAAGAVEAVARRSLALLDGGWDGLRGREAVPAPELWLRSRSFSSATVPVCWRPAARHLAT